MSFKKKAVSLLLTGTLAATVLAPTALASSDGEYMGYQEIIVLPEEVAAPGYAIVSMTDDYNTTYYETDESGRVIEAKYTNYGSEYTQTYTYDNQGRLSAIQYLDDYNDEWANIKLTYDSHGNVIRDEQAYEDTDREDLIDTCIEYEYDDHQNVIKERFSSEYVITYTNKYDSAGNLIQKTEFLDGNPSGWEYKYQYDTNNRLVKEEGVEYGIELARAYEYDSAGRKIKEEIYQEAAGFNNLICTYRYDSAGNLIEKNEYNEDGEFLYSTTYQYKKIGEQTPHVGQFTDVLLSSYYADAVKWAVENEITSGTSNTAFSPDNSCTRAQIMQMLWRASGSPEPTTSNNPFTDVKESDYYYKAVMWAVENNVTSGTTKTTFGSNATCTRGQAMTFLWNAKKKPTASNSISFTDVNSNDYFYNPVKWAVDNGITSGTSATTFSPAQDCTRAQIVTFIYKAMN